MDRAIDLYDLSSTLSWWAEERPMNENNQHVIISAMYGGKVSIYPPCVKHGSGSIMLCFALKETCIFNEGEIARYTWSNTSGQ